MKNNGTPMVHRIPVKDRGGRTLFERDVPSYAGLLDLAHAERLESVTTEILQFASTGNDHTTIVRATVKTSRGTFTGKIGRAHV